MKKILSFVLPLLCLAFIYGCNSKDRLDNPRTLEDELAIASANVSAYSDGYDDGYSDGYDVGYEEACHDIYSLGRSEYDEGFSDAIIGAEEYASENSEWNPEKALEVIEAYNSQTPLLDGKAPSQTEYEEAVSTLWYFCEYFYGVHF